MIFFSFKPTPFYTGLKSPKNHCLLTVRTDRYQTAYARFGGEAILLCLSEFGRRSSGVRSVTKSIYRQSSTGSGNFASPNSSHNSFCAEFFTDLHLFLNGSFNDAVSSLYQGCTLSGHLGDYISCSGTYNL